MVYLSIVAFAIGRFGCGSTDTQLGHSRWHQFRWTSRSGNVASCLLPPASRRGSVLASLCLLRLHVGPRGTPRIICDHGLRRESLADFLLLSLLVSSGALRGGQILIGGSPFARTSTTFLQKLAGSRNLPDASPSAALSSLLVAFFRVRGEIACEFKPVPEGARRLSPLGSIEQLMFVRAARL
jgi:hypothetical protein